MKIAIISPGLSPNVMGGIQRHTYRLAQYLARQGVEIDLYHTDFGYGPFQVSNLNGMSPQEQAQITDISIEWPKGWRIPGHYIRKLKRFSRSAFDVFQTRRSVDFIYGQGLTGWAFVEARRQDTTIPPIGVNLHGYEMFQPQPDLQNYLKAEMLKPPFGRHARKADYVFSLGGKLTQLIDQEVGVESDRIVKISGGIDDNWITSTPSKIIRPLKFVFLGRHERRKGILELHRTLEQNPQWAAQMNFSIIGPIPEASRLQMSHLTYLGQVNSEEKLKKELSESDVLVCPSHSEGMPTVIMEAMARGLAILATDVGAVGDLVSRTNGILMTEPSLVQITNAINRVLDMSDQELASLKANSLQMAESFRWSAVASKTIAKISRLIS